MVSSNEKQNYRKSFEELDAVASKFWPSDLSATEAQISIIPMLLETQDQFISVVGAGARDIEGFFEVVEHSQLSPALFLKHLVILADFGGEMLQRVSREFRLLFPSGDMRFMWRGNLQIYTFKALPAQTFSNKALHIDGKDLLKDYSLSDLQRDAIAILLFGSAHSDEQLSTSSALAKCQIGDYLGRPVELGQFVKQRYIWVSRITGGAQSNNLGQIAQRYVAQYLRDCLMLPGVEIKVGGRLPGVTHTDEATGRLTSFDIVVSRGGKHAAVEVSFQVTTNSVIERKAGQARGRYEQVEQAGHKIAYVLDGAGNFQRASALRTICSFSDCTVAFSRPELDLLCQFITEYFSDEAPS